MRLKFGQIFCIPVAFIMLVSCVPMSQRVNLEHLSREQRAELAQIRVYSIDQSQPPKFEYVGEVTAYSCKALTWDPPASKGNALRQLRKKAYDLKANAIINVTFDRGGQDLTCWESMQAAGTAVVIE
jgi:hypothetical protein